MGVFQGGFGMKIKFNVNVRYVLSRPFQIYHLNIGPSSIGKNNYQL